MEFVSLFIVHILVKTYILQLIKIVLSGKLFPTTEKMETIFIIGVTSLQIKPFTKPLKIFNSFLLLFILIISLYFYSFLYAFKPSFMNL